MVQKFPLGKKKMTAIYFFLVNLINDLKSTHF